MAEQKTYTISPEQFQVDKEGEVVIKNKEFSEDLKRHKKAPQQGFGVAAAEQQARITISISV